MLMVALSATAAMAGVGADGAARSRGAAAAMRGAARVALRLGRQRGCGRQPHRRAFYANRFEKVPSAAAMTAVGRALFRDPSLSASGKMACATCHSPLHAFGPPNGLAVQRGGVDGCEARHARGSFAHVPAKHSAIHRALLRFDEGDDSIDQGPAGGRTWDGRVQSAHDQARVAVVLAFRDGEYRAVEAVVAKVEHSANAAQFREVFGEHVFDDKALAFKGVLMALETYQQTLRSSIPTAASTMPGCEDRRPSRRKRVAGLAAFNDSARGNCARCHPSAVRDGCVSAVHGFRLRGDRCSPQRGDPGERGSPLLRSGAVRAAAHGSYRQAGILRPVSARRRCATRPPVECTSTTACFIG
jgi:cytochrome c peroxidase